MHYTGYKRVTLKDVMLHKGSQSQESMHLWCDSVNAHRRGKSTGSENQLVVVWMGHPGGERGGTANGLGVSFRVDENVLKWIVVMAAQLRGYTKLKTIGLYNLPW